MTPLPTKNYLDLIFIYNPNSGLLYWRTGQNKGKIAGYKNYHDGNNPHSIKVQLGDINARRYNAARIIWKIMTGNDPIDTVDHINNNPFDNRWINLREATIIQQSHNRTAINALNYKGIQKHGNGYRARIMVNGKRICLGPYATIQEAYQAYCNAAKHKHGKFANYG